MPKFLKDTKVEFWKRGQSYQDNEGVFYEGQPEKVAELWASVRGLNMSEYYAHNATWPAPILEFTITRPGFDVSLFTHLKHKGKFYKIVDIDELTDKPRSDMKLRCNYDATYTL